MSLSHLIEAEIIHRKKLAELCNLSLSSPCATEVLNHYCQIQHDVCPRNTLQPYLSRKGMSCNLQMKEWVN